jgi:RimJ/RimL family protein N-acetyltransferase
VRSRTGGVSEDPADLSLPHWAGVLPVHRVYGPPRTDAGVPVAPPTYLPGPRSPWTTSVPLAGRHVRLEPLTPAHSDGLFEALSDDEVWRYLPRLKVRSREEMADHVAEILQAQWRGDQVPWAQVEPDTGAVIGMTSYHDIDPERRSVGIGHTMVGRRWWQSGVNTEAKLMLLERAFEVLGAERVFWYTDIRNERSQRAIARLGASRDGIIRRHRLRPDGTWRDSVMFAMTADEWPGAAQRLRERLAAGGSSALVTS